MELAFKRSATIFDPIPVGIRADGTIASIQIASPSGGIHCLISGMTGAGKSWGENVVLITCGALQCDQILIDPMKETQSYDSIAGCLQMYETDLGRSKKLINQLMNHVIPARTRHLAGEGLKQWSPKSTLKFLRIHVEESWRLADLKALTGLGAALRSAGGQLTNSLQQPTFQYIDTALRNQMGSFRCYGLADDDYAEYGLPEAILKAGASPAQWGNEYPGMHYLVSHGLTTRQKMLPVRSFSDGTGTNTFAAAAARVAATLRPMCTVTAVALGDLWTTRIPPLELVKTTGLIVVGPATGAALDQARGHPPAVEETEETLDQLLDGVTDGLHGEFSGNTEHDLEGLDELAGLEPEDLDMDDFTWDISEDGTEITVTCVDGEDFTIELDDGDASDPDVYAGHDEEVAPDIKRMIGDPPKDGLIPEEFRQVMETRVQAFLAGGDPVLYRAPFVNVSADSGWSMGSVHKFLNNHPRLVKAERGWVPVSQNTPRSLEGAS